MMQLSDNQERRLQELMRVFLEENKKINLSAYRTEEQCWAGNVVDSLGMGDFDVFLRGEKSEERKEKNDQVSILDIGTGGGFPLLPLAILYPEYQFTGVDSTRKKIDAAGRIIEAMGTQNVQLVTGRCEELGRSSGMRERFDIVTARAVASLPVLLEYMSPFAKEGGVLLCWKSLKCEEEIASAQKACDLLSCELIKRSEYDLGNEYGKRQILVYRKILPLSREFPRGVGIAKGKPLGK